MPNNNGLTILPSLVKKNQFVFACLLIAGVTFVAFLPSLGNGFTNWDDDFYVTANPDIRGFSSHNVKSILSSVYQNQYQPITMLTYMAEYSLFRLNPYPYHIINLLLHILNASLVLFLIRKLSGSLLVGLVTALLFAIHPLRVESVAWISERKDVLSAFFYFASMILYVEYLHKKSAYFYAGALVILIVSLLSKPMAVSIPFVFLLLDYFYKRKIDKKVLLEKIPFFIVAGIFAFLAYTTIGDKSVHFQVGSLLERILAPGFSIAFYLFKTLIPIDLCALYQFPGIKNGSMLGLMVLSNGLVLAICIALVLYRKHSRTLRFGFVFFIITLVPVLQIITSGGWAFVADRYTYIPMIGLYFIVAMFCNYLYSTKLTNRTLPKFVGFIGLSTLVISLSYLTFKQCYVWKNSISLWNQTIAKSPSAIAYINRGKAYELQHEYQNALSDYDNALTFDPRNVKAFDNKGVALYEIKEYVQALSNYNQAIEIDPMYDKTYDNRGILYATQKEYGNAIEDFQKAIQLNPKNVQAYNHLGNTYCYDGKYPEAQAAFTNAIKLDCNNSKGYFGRGLVSCFLADWTNAIAEFDSAIKHDPDYAEAFNNRGSAKNHAGDIVGALKDYSIAIALNSFYVQAYFSRGLIYKTQGDFHLAQRDFDKACELGFSKACELTRVN